MDVLLILGLVFLLIYAMSNYCNVIDKHEYSENKEIGDIGERIVASRLSRLPEDYTVSHDVKYRGVQIDHLVINQKLKIIFVVETKMWGGKVTGSYQDKMWLQVKNGEKKYLDNPIKQNEYHCRVIRKKYIGYTVHSIVVFVRNNNVPKYDKVINENDLLNYIFRLSNRYIIGF